MFEDFLQHVPPVNVLNHGPRDPEVIRIVAEFKRLADIWRLDADFREKYRLDPEKAIAEKGLSIDPEAFRMYLNPDEAERRLQDILDGTCGPEALPKSFLLYQAAVREHQQTHKQQRETLCVPDEPRFKAWRARQVKRCLRQFGHFSENMMQFPLVFELSEGCSVGCSFCAFAAKKLQGVFRYTNEHGVLWREILSRLHALIGEAAGHGFCFYATEGLDNPDYEKFLADYYQEFGVVPPTTTAAATRDIERTRALLRFNQEFGYYVDRFSVLSPAMRDILFESFTPEELLRVLILPQFPEAPDSNFTKAGRNRDEDDLDNAGGTISCVSGFIVNMQEKSVRLITPYTSDRDHPTGEWILEKCEFTSAEDLEAQIRRMISQYMPEKFDLNRLCCISCDFHLQEKDGKVWAFVGNHGSVLLQTSIKQETLDVLNAALKEQTHSGNDLLELLSGDMDFIPCFLLLNLLWHNGLIITN